MCTRSRRRRSRVGPWPDWYYRRLTIHKVASYATIPLFATEYVLGNKLYDGDASSRATRSMDRYAVRKDGSNFVVSLETLFEQDKQKSHWESAFVTA